MVREIKQPGKYRRGTKISLSAIVSPVNNFQGRQRACAYQYLLSVYTNSFIGVTSLIITWVWSVESVPYWSIFQGFVFNKRLQSTLSLTVTSSEPPWRTPCMAFNWEKHSTGYLDFFPALPCVLSPAPRQPLKLEVPFSWFSSSRWLQREQTAYRNVLKVVKGVKPL